MHQSISSWMACGDCSDLIEADDYVTLADQCAERLVKAGAGFPVEVIREMTMTVHQGFRDHRSGERIGWG